MNYDKRDFKMLDKISESPEGIGLTKVAAHVGMSPTAARYRLMQMALNGDIEIEQVHNRMNLYPKKSANKNGNGFMDIESQATSLVN